MRIEIKVRYRFDKNDLAKIKAELKSHKIKMKELAQYLGWSRTYMYDVLNGKLDGTNLYHYLNDLGILCELDETVVSK